MAHSLATTDNEFEGATHAATIGVLVFVLRYEDLCAGDSVALHPLTHDGAGFEIGRASEVRPPAMEGKTFLLPDRFVSRVHARVVRRDGKGFLEDAGSKLGTFVRGERIQGPVALADGDVVEMGQSLFVYRLVDEPTAVRMMTHRAGFAFGPTRTLCPEVMRLAVDLDRLARSDQPILLLAETGAGKEVAARYVHDRSGRAGPFVAVDCGAIPEHLVEGELFGHRRGAFSGAHEERKGRIRSAEGGTVFLDEIGNLPGTAQASLLRAIQENEVTPVGADRGQKVDVRWMAATNVDVFSEKSGFRADLRERLAGYVGMLPPLRKRREDLGVLVAHLLARRGVERASITRAAARALFLGDLPGNVREIERSLGSACLLMGDGPIDLQHLSALRARAASEKEEPASEPPGVEATDEVRRNKARPPRERIEAALFRAKGSQVEAARLLGVHERQFARWMDAYGIPRPRKGPSGG
ncbi:sigma 54-interacting transcriptional regulator [Polyangium jinanense]|uniref:Sigma 54-interacting transcriptional regulator n=1 Tax=Polyangium jinanense TaxID=2829994 RepID=A0A9X3X3N8_9BACT|nr:sigma 54-interacting transcriptional regulator [Polyangium jinanense]MDC3954473.1 sigma 54-interacting transcriptional regulator [Polyangium jinanense]MDC3980776.1 sigma 54-interacting transcriptional regulator [Polyangium jinanense]